MLENAHLKKDNEILQELVKQQVEEIDWQFKENERLRNILSELPDEGEIKETIEVYGVDMGDHLYVSNERLDAFAKALARRIETC